MFKSWRNSLNAVFRYPSQEAKDGISEATVTLTFHLMATEIKSVHPSFQVNVSAKPETVP